jgi:hypothetical protein
MGVCVGMAVTEHGAGIVAPGDVSRPRHVGDYSESII